MADGNFGAIPSNTTLGASQSVRRNAANNAYEAFTPVDTVGDGWNPATGSWDYASASSLTVPSGAASIYSVGMWVKITQTTVKYFKITAVADTVLTVSGYNGATVANAAITLNRYSSAWQPLGSPILDKCRATGSSTVANVTDTRIACNAETYDTNTMHDNSTNNSRVTIKTSGYYDILCSAEFTGNDTGIRSVQIFKNGGALRLYTVNTTTGTTTYLQVKDTFYLLAGDYIENNVYQTSGGNLSVAGAVVVIQLP